jgi:hypothetical protein
VFGGGYSDAGPHLLYQALALDAEDTAHAIVVEGVGSAFLWTVEPAEDFRRRIDQWRARTIKSLRP